LFFGALEMTYPVYLGRKEELTDANGVFNVVEAERLVRGKAAWYASGLIGVVGVWAFGELFFPHAAAN
jgi:hypothetical protein